MNAKKKQPRPPVRRPASAGTGGGKSTIGTKPSGGAKSPAKRPATSPATTKRFPVFWVAIGAVLAIAVVAAIVASGGDDKPSSGGSGTGHEYGPVKVTGDPLPRYEAGGEDPAVGDTIPTVAGEDFSGTPVTIAPDGKAQMVVFLAHWCPHCNAEAPKLAQYLRDNGGVPDNVTLTLVATGSQDTAPNWPPSQWVKDMGLGSVPVLADDKEGTAAAAYGLSAYPFIVAIDSDGKVVDRRSGEQPDGFFDKAFTALADGSTYPGS